MDCKLGGIHMWKKIIGSAVLLVLIGIAIFQAMDRQGPTSASNEQLGGLKIGVKAPDFELKSLTGESVKLSDYEGKKVILNFWATWCPPCREEMPDMEKFSQVMEDDVVILAVNIDPENDVQAFVKEYGVTFTILLDSQSSKNPVNDQYQVLSIPTTYFIDSKGIIQDVYRTAMSESYIKDTTNQME